ncbi:outer membrane protein assembly factor BamB [Thermomonas flagellata]|uniref:outer membrane protein assembly factor BamB n=1 Tax=Thermomonas flagellata TaxID=2888524 RepID=UPI0023D91986|nr:outer membrane protein assembly factor BamB [Thermomonas flagellata]
MSHPIRHFARSGLVLLLAAGMLAGCSTVKNVFAGRGQDKALEPTPLAQIAPTITATRLWDVKIGKGEKDLGLGQHPAILDGRVYAAAVDGGVYALDLKTGQTLWHTPSKLALSGGPGVGEGLVVVGSLKGDVVAYDAQTGAEKWTAKVGNEVIAAPAIGGGLVFVHSNDDRVTAFDAASGERRWFYTVDQPALTVRGTGPVTLGPGIVFVGHDNGTVTALSPNDGSVLWSAAVAEPDGRSELERMADVDGPVVLNGRVLYATSYKNHTVAIDGPSGQVLWDRDTGGPRGLGLSNSAVVVTDPAGKVWALDRNTGGSLWQQEGLAHRNTTAPAVQGDHALVGDLEGYVHWLQLKDGAFAARAKLGAPIVAQPVVADDIAVIQTRDGELAAFRLQ